MKHCAMKYYYWEWCEDEFMKKFKASIAEMLQKRMIDETILLEIIESNLKELYPEIDESATLEMLKRIEYRTELMCKEELTKEEYNEYRL